MGRRILLVGLLIAGYLVARAVWMEDLESGPFEADRPTEAELDRAIELLDTPGSSAKPAAASIAEEVPGRLPVSYVQAEPVETKDPSFQTHQDEAILAPEAGALVPVPVSAPSPSLLSSSSGPAAATGSAGGSSAVQPPGEMPGGGEDPSTAGSTALPTVSLDTATPVTLPPAGGVFSAEPAGEWVTSAHASASHYCSSAFEARWREWSPENRVWFASESELLAAYPGRTRVDPPASPTAISSPSATFTSVATASPTAWTPSPTATPRPTNTVPAGGIISAEPAGEWVTSTHSSAQYYTVRSNEARWREWSAENRIWFQTEGELLAAYPGRALDLPPATATPSATATSTAVPSATASPSPSATATTASTSTPTLEPTTAPSPDPTESPPTPVATHTPVPSPTLTPSPAPTETSSSEGIRSPDPAGDWVTSVESGCRYYCSKGSSFWLSWSPDNRIWFESEPDLLAAYPGRLRR